MLRAHAEAHAALDRVLPPGQEAPISVMRAVAARFDDVVKSADLWAAQMRSQVETAVSHEHQGH